MLSGQATLGAQALPADSARGVRVGDVIVAVDGRTEPQHESELLAYGVQKKAPGDKLTLTVLRGGEKTDITFALK